MKPGWVPSWCERVSLHPRKAKLGGFSSPTESALPGATSPSRQRFGAERALQRLCGNLPLGPAWAAEWLPGRSRRTRFCDTILDHIRDEELGVDRAPSNCPRSTAPWVTMLKALEGA